MPEDSSERRSVLGRTIDIKTAIWIATTAILVVSTYFATRSQMESRIGALEAYMQSQSPLDVASKKAAVFDQINSLTLLEKDIIGLKEQIRQLPRLQLQYGTYHDLPGINAAIVPSALPSVEVLIGLGTPDKQAVFVLEASQLPQVSFSEAIRTLSDTNLVADLFDIALLVNRYNMAMYQNGISYPYANWYHSPPPNNGFSLGASKIGVQKWELASTRSLTRLTALLEGTILARISDKRAELRGLIP